MGAAGPREPQPPASAPPEPPQTFDPEVEYGDPDSAANGNALEPELEEAREPEPEPFDLDSKPWEEGARPFDPADIEVSYERGESRLPHLPEIELPKPQLPKPHLPKPHLPKVEMPRPRLPRVGKPSLPKLSLPRIPLPKLPRPSLRALRRKPKSRTSAPPPRQLRRELRQPRPAPRRPRRSGSLLVPTAKVAAALALVTATAAAIGSALGLPLPAATDDGSSNLAGTGPPIAEGTAPTLSNGPFHPIKVQLVNYGESAARFGGGRGHEGQDMFAGVGTPLVAVRAGEVVDTSVEHKAYVGGRGNYLYIYSPQDGRSYGYFHMKSPPTLRIGDKVAAGQEAGRLGCTGSCDGPHLHFEARIGRASFGADTKPINPLPLLKQWPPVPGSTRGNGLPQSPAYKGP